MTSEAGQRSDQITDPGGHHESQTCSGFWRNCSKVKGISNRLTRATDKSLALLATGNTKYWLCSAEAIGFLDVACFDMPLWVLSLQMRRFVDVIQPEITSIWSLNENRETLAVNPNSRIYAFAIIAMVYPN
ncbi:hypothetical protein TNCV_40061 [Trichonephila clavipes]|nr:hypothetical protein TNCV_40061 [Trichonephila clavipes]